MIEALKKRIIELVGIWVDPFEEYYTHENADMWKWNYPLTKYNKETWPLCHVGDDPDQSYVDCLKSIVNILEEKDREGTLIIDRTRPIWKNMDNTNKRFFENLYVQHREIAAWSYRNLYCGKYTANEVLNMTSKKLSEKGLSVNMKRENMFELPF